MDLEQMRQEYENSGITKRDFDADPLAQFDVWMQAAVAAGLDEPNAMVLSTVDPDGQPWSRYVLLKRASADGFDFYTNYQSHKSVHLAAQPKASLTFGWLSLRRQVNISGSVERISAGESNDYWEVRPRGSQLGALASDQSRPLPNRQSLLDRYVRLDLAHPDDVPRPPHWGGWRLAPHTVEFWQGRQNRLHDRLRYSLVEGQWQLTRLAP